MRTRFLLDFAAALVIGTAVGLDHGWLLGLFIGIAFWSIDLAFVGQQLAHQRITALEEELAVWETAMTNDDDEPEEEKSE